MVVMMNKPTLIRDPDSSEWWVVLEGDCIKADPDPVYLAGWMDRYLTHQCHKADKVIEACLAWGKDDFQAGRSEMNLVRAIREIL